MKERFLTLIVLMGLLTPFTARGDDLGMQALSWGLTLEELNRVYQEKVNPAAALREDSQVHEIELQLQPNKTLKVNRGALTAIQETTKGAASGVVGKPFGYLWEGKFFGRVVFYANKPGQSRGQIMRELKAQFPEGRLFHKLSGGLMITDYELHSGKMIIFTNERGVYYYEPAVLQRVIREEERKQQERLDREGERRFQEKANSPF